VPARRSLVEGSTFEEQVGAEGAAIARAAIREFIKPYYARIGAVCREQGVHWWLHSCGNNTDIMDCLYKLLARVRLFCVLTGTAASKTICACV
jgi:hypothetical protein